MTVRATVLAVVACVTLTGFGNSLGASISDGALAGDPMPLCLRTLQRTPNGRRIPVDAWRRYTDSLTIDSTVLAHLNAQPEFTQPVWDYVAVIVDAERIVDGQRAMVQYREVLDAIQQRTHVDPATIVAIWGVESNFGRGAGTMSVLRSLATLSCAGRRQQYFRGEFFSALRIVEAGHIQPEQFLGSWAGAFGQTQFMPGSFERLAVDQDGDGRKDVISNVGDALASTANYLQHAGWQADASWGVEVRTPKSLLTTPHVEGRRAKHAMAAWAARGVRLVDGRPLSAVVRDSAALAGLFTPTGPDGPAFLVMRNFDAVFHYNASVSYTLAVSHLADRIRGGGPFVAAWPTTDLGLSRADRRELQTLLAQRGHPVGAPSGVLTAATRSAIRAEQQRLGVVVTGRAGQQLLARLRNAHS